MSRGFIYTAIIVVGVILLGIGPLVMAGGYKPIVNNYTINEGDTINQITEVSHPMTVTDGISDRELAEGIATAIAGGSHQFDHATLDWQGSITAAFEADEEVDAVSFGIGKRWESIDALFHGGYTQMGSSDFVQVGATFRF